MSPKSGKRVLKPGRASVFIGEESGRAPFSLKLDVREDAREERALFGKRPGLELGRPKLFHYISAGGMRQLRRTSGDDWVEDRRRSFLVFLFWVALVWIVFYFLPAA